jgi:prepilin-type processing-associated H-X9-DG protein
MNIERGLLFPYTASVGIYRCPADRSNVRTPAGEILPLRRVRSYNLSQSINWIPLASKYFIPPPSFEKESQINDPASAQLLVFIEVHEDAILDPHFEIPPPGWRELRGYPDRWWDLPADRHGQGGNLSFADGHVEHWKWEAPKVFRQMGQAIASANEAKDYRRLQAAVRPERRP